MRHLILGGTGTVGGVVVRGLLDKGETVRVLTRSAERARALPKGAETVLGDLTDPGTYERVFTGDDTLFLLTANGPTDLMEGLVAVNEAKRSKVKRVVHLSIHDVEKCPEAPHFASKIAIEHALRESGLAYTILRPNNFYQNDYWFKDAILQYGVYPQPIGGVGLSRVDSRDIAEAAVRALTDGGHFGKTYALVGPDPVTGESCAAEFAKALDKPVAYGGDDLAAWAKSMAAYMPAWAVYDYAIMYAMFQAKGLKATAAQLDETRTILGREPRKFSDFVGETVAAWKA
ncbi:MAG: NmrA family NAD(P)-binding protein [Acidobacteria bacterium]|nr:NmrA family NAD(P)-binding protein [Acidobacteriota bacterium]MCA1610504.1 NmrA family NAD(P)-binding protein [Acidobacteriota bacterium]